MRSIYITHDNHRRLHSLVEAASKDSRNREVVRDLEGELSRAQVVPTADLPPDVITMHSTVRVLDLDGREEMLFTLVFPGQARVEEGRLSVLAPLGTALLGYRSGDVLTWNTPGGPRRLKVLEVVYQPEADHNSSAPA